MLPHAVAPSPLGSFTSFDWALVFLLVISTLLALRRGIIRTLFSFAGLIAGILLASWNYAALATHLRPWVTGVATAQIVAFLLILSGTLVVCTLLAGIVRRSASLVGLGFVDRVLGAAFGFLRGVLLGVAAMMAIAAFEPNTPWLTGSRLAPYFLDGAHAVSFVVPKRFKEQISTGVAYLLQKTPELLSPHPLSQSR